MLNKFELFLVLLLILVLSWWRLFVYKKRKSTLLFPSQWKNILERKIEYYRHLSESEKARFEKSILAFLEDVTITGIETIVEDTDRLMVAASAIIPIFGFPEWRYRNLNEVLLYSQTFDHDYQTKGGDRNILGMVGEGAMNRMMILSKPALHQGFEDPHSTSNVGIHEFIHLVDKSDGSTDGIPEVLIKNPVVIPWLQMMHREIENIKSRHSDINPYAGASQSEFLSVVGEYFFKQPEALEKKHPELFSLLEQIFRQKPGSK
jgi:Mlc titration factor MtfA (ptsG expression regulator)